MSKAKQQNTRKTGKISSSQNRLSKDDSKSEGMARQLIELLRECVLSHHWADVSKVLLAIVRERTLPQATISHVGYEVFYQDPCHRMGMFTEFFNVLRKFPDFGSAELALEFYLYNLIHQNGDQLKMLDGNLVEKRRGRPTKLTAEQTVTFQGYKGVTYYLEWKKTLKELKETGVTDEGLQHEDKLTVLGNRSIQVFSSLHSGVAQEEIWDMFLPPYVILLEFYQKYDKLNEILWSYHNTHENDPFPLKLLYDFNEQHQVDKDIKLQLLKKLHMKMPFSDIITLDLYCHLSKQHSTHEQTLPLLFNALDYHCSKGNIQLWTLLAQQLGAILQGGDLADLAILQQCWSDRSAWWPEYQFNTELVDTSDVLMQKGIVAAQLMGQENTYTNWVLGETELPNDEKEQVIAEVKIRNVPESQNKRKKKKHKKVKKNKRRKLDEEKEETKEISDKEEM